MTNTHAQDQNQTSDAHAAELQSTVDKYEAAYNSGDVDQVMSFWSENADFVDIRGRFHEGRDLISALFRRGFADNPGRTIRLESLARKFLSPSVAMDDGILILTSGDGVSRRGRYTVVWTKHDDRWRIRSARDIPIEAEELEDEESAPPLEELAWMVGEWEAKAEDYQVAIDCQWRLDRSFLVQMFSVKSNDESFRVVTYIAYDPAEERFRSWYFDSRGGFGGGAWSRSDNVYMIPTVSVLPDGTLGSYVMTWEQVGENKANWSAVQREVDGEPLADAIVKYSRVK